MQDSLAPGHQTRALVINSKTASETASENQTRFVFCVDGSVNGSPPKDIFLGFHELPVMVKFKLKRRYTWERDFLRGGTAPLGLGDGRS